MPSQGSVPARTRPGLPQQGGAAALSGAELRPSGEQRLARSARGRGVLALRAGSSFQNQPPPPALLAAGHLQGEEWRS